MNKNLILLFFFSFTLFFSLFFPFLSSFQYQGTFVWPQSCPPSMFGTSSIFIFISIAIIQSLQLATTHIKRTHLHGEVYARVFAIKFERELYLLNEAWMYRVIYKECVRQTCHHDPSIFQILLSAFNG